MGASLPHLDGATISPQIGQEGDHQPCKLGIAVICPLAERHGQLEPNQGGAADRPNLESRAAQGRTQNCHRSDTKSRFSWNCSVLFLRRQR